MKKKIYIPTNSVECWRNLLADKERQWKSGFSALETALSWEKTNDLPSEIKRTLKTEPAFKDIELLFAFPEYKVSLPGGKTASQNDVLAVLRTESALTILSVEGKAKEDFDKTIINWKKTRSDKGVKERLGYILTKIGVTDSGIELLRYQLFHRLASAVIMAEKFHAKNAVMIIQSFNDNDEQNHFRDFNDFLKLYNVHSVEKNKMYRLTEINNICVFAAWTQSEVASLKK